MTCKPNPPAAQAQQVIGYVNPAPAATQAVVPSPVHTVMAAQAQPAAVPDGRLHDDGYFTWNTKKHPPWTRPTVLPCDFWLAAQPVAAVPAQSQPAGIADLRCAAWLDPECAEAGACQSLRFKAQAQQEPLSDEHVRAALNAAAAKHRIEAHDFYRVLASELRGIGAAAPAQGEQQAPQEQPR